jgi:hypothetical protein
MQTRGKNRETNSPAITVNLVETIKTITAEKRPPQKKKGFYHHCPDIPNHRQTLLAY